MEFGYYILTKDQNFILVFVHNNISKNLGTFVTSEKEPTSDFKMILNIENPEASGSSSNMSNSNKERL